MKRILFALMLLMGGISISAQSTAIYGDVNNDGQVNHLDVNAISDIIMGKVASTESADVNKDTKVNVGDIVVVVNTINDRSLVLWFKDGSKACYKLDENVETTFTSESLNLTANKKTVSYPLSEISRYTYESSTEDYDNTNFGSPTESTDTYEYFTIYFGDGTKSQAFYTTDVELICYSKIGLDGIEYDNYQIQEIYTCDSVYRYPLTQINSLRFKDVDELIVGEDIKRVNELVLPIYTECSSTSEISKYLPVIKEIEGVEDAWVDNQTLFVKIRDWETIFFLYPSKQDENANNRRSLSRAVQSNMFVTRQISNNDTDLNSICIVDLFAKHEGNSKETEEIDKLIDMFNDYGIEVKLYREPTDKFPDSSPAMPEFFRDEIFDYDMVFLNTHGSYNEKNGVHNLATGEVLMTTAKTLDKEALKKITTELDLTWAKRRFEYKHGDSPSGLSYIWAREKRNGEWFLICYTSVSRKYITSLSNKNFHKNGKTIVFNAACQSMGKTLADKKTKIIDDGLAKTFIKRGAGCYFGYDDTNRFGGFGGSYLFINLAYAAKSVGYSFTHLPDWVLKDVDNEEKTIANLRIYPLGTEPKQLRQSYPQTLQVKDETEGSDIKVTLQTSIRIYAPLSDKANDNKYGIDLSKNSDFSELIPLNRSNYFGDYDENQKVLHINYTLSNHELQPNTTYYYRAYMTDGYSDCYGEIKSFTTKGDNELNGDEEAYAVLSDSTLIFYYDNKKEERTKGQIFKIEESLGGWALLPLWDAKMVKKAVFDPSFMYYTPISTVRWFEKCSNLENIDNIEYLNTTEVTDMSFMFYDCESLTSLDLSSFNTGKVTNMSYMFDGCSSLTILNLSNFNTCNVTDMRQMFNNCESLTSLDLSSFNTSNVKEYMGNMFYHCFSLTNLDIRNLVLTEANGISLFSGLKNLEHVNLSNADTSNATDMNCMFFDCESLTSLDLSSFNTANVIDMSGMFNGCIALTSLNICNFNTSNVADMNGMFTDCSSLTSLDLSHFNTAKVTDMGGMFLSCSSLTSLDLSSFNTVNVANMRGLFRSCSSLTSLDLSSFNTINVTNMSEMFSGCSSLTNLDLSSFNTVNVANMRGLFRSCSSIKTIYANNWNVSSRDDSMFYDCINLVGGQGTKIGRNLYDYDKYGNPLYYYCESNGLAAHIDGGKDNPGLFTAK